jgi:hypothetical protein
MREHGVDMINDLDERRMISARYRTGDLTISKFFDKIMASKVRSVFVSRTEICMLRSQIVLSVQNCLHDYHCGWNS